MANKDEYISRVIIHNPMHTASLLRHSTSQ